jgi:hypothetical protein
VLRPKSAMREVKVGRGGQLSRFKIMPPPPKPQ